jgi:hypothetical protein
MQHSLGMHLFAKYSANAALVVIDVLAFRSEMICDLRQSCVGVAI